MKVIQDKIYSAFNSGKFDFNTLALDVYAFQYNNNPVYNKFCNYLNKTPQTVSSIEKIPFLPIEFFKTQKVLCTGYKAETVFYSSGTTGHKSSKHFVASTKLYEKSFINAFEIFYGNPSQYCLLALLPSYLERQDSSLVFMVNTLIKKTNDINSGFYLNNLEELYKKIIKLKNSNRKIFLLGVSFALLELAKKYPVKISDAIIMETGGMKGKGKDLIRKELHEVLCNSFNVEKIHSEYGMTELLSQAYSSGGGIFKSPRWMRVFTRNVNDPLEILPPSKKGALNIIDLANVYSCSFIATDDLGICHKDNSFEVTGRMDLSDIRGCNLLV